MGLLSLNLPTVGQPNSTEDAKIRTALDTIQTEFNGNIETANLADDAVTAAKIAAGVIDADLLATAELDVLGLNSTATTRRGKSVISTSESRTNTAYGLLTTPDQVSGLTLPADGLIVVAYTATWQESVQNAAKAAIFLDDTQLKVAGSGGGAAVVQECGLGLAATDTFLGTTGTGLHSSGGSAYSGVTTGQVLGQANGLIGDGTFCGVCYIFAAAGTYDVSVRFKASSGSVTAKNRTLRVWTMDF